MGFCYSTCADVLLTVDLADGSVTSSDTVNVTVCHGQSSALNITCSVEGNLDNPFLPRICLVQRNEPIQHISYRDKRALEKNNISILHHSQNLLQFEHKVPDSKTADGLIVYCELENTASAQVVYREGMLCTCVCVCVYVCVCVSVCMCVCERVCMCVVSVSLIGIVYIKEALSDICINQEIVLTRYLRTKLY